jgi:TonB family protein
MLKTPQPSRRRRNLATGALAVLFWGGVAAAWAAKPVEIVATPSPQAGQRQADTAIPPLASHETQVARLEPHLQTAEAAAQAPQVSVSNSVIRSGADTAPASVPAPPPRPSIIDDPAWQQVPDADDLAKLYPPDAARAEATGKATLSCLVTADGSVTGCSVIGETPPGLGFGDSALAMTDKFKMNPANVAPGSTVTIPILFKLK